MSQQKKPNQQSTAKNCYYEAFYNEVTKGYDQLGIYLKSYPLLDQEERIDAAKYGKLLAAASHYNKLQANRMRELEKKVDENHKLMLKKLASIKLNVDLNLTNTNALLKGVTNTSKKRKDITLKETWRKWIKSPQGVTQLALLLIGGILILK